jgi:hypothetical protein
MPPLGGALIEIVGQISGDRIGGGEIGGERRGPDRIDDEGKNADAELVDYHRGRRRGREQRLQRSPNGVELQRNIVGLGIVETAITHEMASELATPDVAVCLLDRVIRGPNRF